MEIKVGPVVDKIIVRKSDVVDIVINEFVLKHKLSANKQEKLTEMVMNTIKQYQIYNSNRKVE
jgi:hypothetical protein